MVTSCASSLRAGLSPSIYWDAVPRKGSLTVKCLSRCPLKKKHFDMIFLVRFSRKFVFFILAVSRPSTLNEYSGQCRLICALDRVRIQWNARPSASTAVRPPPSAPLPTDPASPLSPPPAQAAPTRSICFPLSTPPSAAPSQPGTSRPLPGPSRPSPRGRCAALRGRGSHDHCFQSPRRAGEGAAFPPERRVREAHTHPLPPLLCSARNRARAEPDARGYGERRRPEGAGEFFLKRLRNRGAPSPHHN